MEAKLGFGGSCHWCTEAIFQSLKGVTKVSQGWITADASGAPASEAVIVEYDPAVISAETLIEVHLHTHSCMSDHSRRLRYLSAVYTFTKEQAAQAKVALAHFQADFPERIITQVIPFGSFRLNEERYLDYFYKNPDKPFCQTYISPKLRILLTQFADVADTRRLSGSSHKRGKLLLKQIMGKLQKS